MKKYLFTAIALLNMNVYAESNPFDLQKNLQKIDKDQEVLFSALQEISDKKESQEEINSTEANSSDKSTRSSENNARQTEIVATSSTEINETSREGVIGEEPMSQDRQKPEVLVEESSKIVQDKIAIQKAAEEIAKVKAREEQELVVQKNEQEKREVEAYEAERLAKVAKENKIQKLPERLQHYKDIVNAKVEKKGEPLKGKTKSILESILREKNNPNFSLNDAKKIIDGNKDAGMAIVTYMMGKSLIYYNQLNPKEKANFDKNLLEEGQEKKGKSEADEFAMYAEKYPEEVKEIAFSFLEDILENGIPEVNFKTQVSGNFSINSKDAKSSIMGANTATEQRNSVPLADINLTAEKMMEKEQADRLLREAMKEVD